MEENGDYATREGKPVDDKSTLRTLIEEEVVKIVEVAGKRYYVVRLGTNEYALIVALGQTGYWVVKTTLTSDTLSGLFKSVKNAIDDGINAGDDQIEVIYDPETHPEC